MRAGQGGVESGEPSGTYLATFFLCLAVFCFELVSVRTMVFVLGSGFVYFVLSLAMLGLSAAGSWMSLFHKPLQRRERDLKLSRSCVLMAVLFLVSFAGSTVLKDRINHDAALFASQGGFDSLVLHIMANRFVVALQIGAIMSLPYFVFGYILTLLFSTCADREYNKLYFSDLLGGAAGCVVAYLAMEHGSYAISVVLPTLLALLAAAAYGAASLSRRAVLLVLCLVPLSLLAITPVAQRLLEPRPLLSTLGRDYAMERDVSEFWHGWNSFSRVGALRMVKEPDSIRHTMALGNGEGHAAFWPYRPGGEVNRLFEPGKLATALGVPRDALVLFAGVGADMLAIDALSDGRSNITGVELNRTMIEGALAQPDFRLQEFFARPNIELVAAEARAFLQSDAKLYDVIVLSWSGATTAYYAGSIGHTTQFVYTRQALELLIDHLKPGGFIAYMNTNKVNTLAALREVMDSRGLPHPERAAVVLYQPGAETAHWKRWWDENRLLIKPDGFTREDLATVQATADELGLQVAYSAWHSDPDYGPYRKVLTDASLPTALRELNEESNLRFSVVTDDRPFSFDLFRSERYFAAEFWRAAFAKSAKGPYERYRGQQVAFVGAIVLAAAVLILGPLLVSRGPKPSWSSMNHLLFFTALGFGFMLIEIAIMHKMSLLFGNPGLSIAIVLSSIVLSAGFGSWLSNASFAAGLSFARVVLLILAYLAVYLAFSDAIIGAVMGWPLLANVLLVALIVAPAGILMGHLFPQGLVLARADDTHLVPWAWAINGVSGTIAAGVAPLLAMLVGFNLLIIAGALCYATILVLPRYRGGRVPIAR